MKNPEQYQQGALTFPRPQPTETPALRDPDLSPAAPLSRSASDRLGDDLWHEYRLEVENRERLALPTVSLDEFADMRDWSDGLMEPEDIAWPSVPDEPPYERKKTE